MKTLKNRVISGAMAGVLALSLAVPSLASEKSTEISGSFQDTPIAVSVPTTGVAFINPYGLDIKVPEDATDESNTGEATISGQQIVTAPMAIKNESAMNLSVNVTVTGAVDIDVTDMKFATSSTKGTPNLPETDPNYVAPATSKSAFVYLQAKSAADTTGSAASIATEYAAWAASAYNADTDVVVGTRAVTKEGLVVLRAADTSGSTPTYQTGSIALYRLAGDCVVSPRSAWADEDAFTATIAFTFSPTELTKYNITVATPTVESGVTAGTVNADVTSAADLTTVTITAVVSDAGTDGAEVTVTDADGNNINVTQTGSSGGTYTFTFTMPASNVTVNTVFTDIT